MKIDTDIPIPPRANTANGSRPQNPVVIATMRALGIGHSTLVEGRTLSTLNCTARRILGAGNYVIRAEGAGYRVWRKA